MSPAPTPRCSLADRPQPRHAFAQGTAPRDPAALAGAAHATLEYIARATTNVRAVPPAADRCAVLQSNLQFRGNLAVS